MPYSPTTNTNINVVLSNDLSGTLDNPYVISVEHIKQGILSVFNGGTGTSSIPAGNLLIGTGGDSLSSLSGNQDDILTWSNASGSWITKHIDIVEDINISASENSLFEIIDFSILKNKNFYISFKNQSPNLFLASPTGTSGQLLLRPIQQSDLPYLYEGITILDSNFSGTFIGNGQFTNLSGDGSGLVNLTSSKIVDFEDRVIDLFSQKPHTFDQITAQTASISKVFVNDVAYISGVFDGIFQGSGELLENIQTENIYEFYENIYKGFTGSSGINFISGNISAPGLVYNFIPYDNNIFINKLDQTYHFGLSNNLTASSAKFNVISSSNIFTDILELSFISADNILAQQVSGVFIGSLYGTYFGPGNGINNIPNSSLDYDYIIINGQQVNLGSGIQVGGISLITSSDSNLHISVSSSTVNLNISDTPSFSSVISDYIYSNGISSSNFIGDGYNISNLNFNNIQQATIQNLNSDEINASSLEASSIFANSLSSSYIYGDGFNIKNINIDNITGLSFVLDKVFSGSENIQIITNEFSEVSVKLKDNISVNSITGSFSGDASGLSNIQAPSVKKYICNDASIGNIVYINSNNQVSKANNSTKQSSNPIGIVINTSNGYATVQTNGSCYVSSSIINQNCGDLVFLGSNGDAVNYSDIGINSYAVQVGTLIENNTVFIDFKKLWKVK